MEGEDKPERGKKRIPEMIQWRLPHEHYMLVLNEERQRHRKRADADWQQLEGAKHAIANFFDPNDRQMIRQIIQRKLVIETDLLGDVEFHPLMGCYVTRVDGYPWCLGGMLAMFDLMDLRSITTGRALTVEIFSSHLQGERHQSSSRPYPNRVHQAIYYSSDTA